MVYRHRLTFWLTISPQNFTALVDAPMWIMYNQGVPAAIHYLDDYLIIGDPHTQECSQALQPTSSFGRAPGGICKLAAIMPTSFHLERNVAHHCKSD